MLDYHSAVFQEGLGKLKRHKAKIILDSQATPCFCKARPVPYELKAKVEEELDRLAAEGIIEPRQFADWAAPIVPVLKGDQTVCICGGQPAVVLSLDSIIVIVFCCDFILKLIPLKVLHQSLHS